MESLLKNQLLKHLSKFAKNLASTNINLSTFKGEGVLYNLDLNEKVLTDLLELPTWMEISSATVNKVKAKIPWVKLKSCPIILSLDRVHIVIKTVPNLRQPEAHAENSTSASPSKYGLVNKAIDGITVEVDSVFIEVQRDSYTANLEIAQMCLKSKNSLWKDCSTDLRTSRFKDPNMENVLIFKELSWSSTRIVIHGPQKTNQSPLRLHTKGVICRMTIKKKISDCSVIGCRLVLIMDKIDWCLTDSQLLLLVQFTDSISELVKKATQESQKIKAARKFESIHLSKSTDKSDVKTWGSRDTLGLPAGSLRKGISNGEVEKWMIFRKYDVVETSYHFACEQILLCIYDDNGNGRSVHEALKKGSSIELRFFAIKIDHFPYHLAAGDRKHWIRYQEGNLYEWTRNAISQFKVKLVDSFPGKSASSHTPLGRATPHTPGSNQGTPSKNSKGEDLSSTQMGALKQFNQLMSTCTVIACSDFDIKFVRNIGGNLVHKFIVSVDKKAAGLNTSEGFMQAELSYFFYPGGYKFPVPSPKLFMHVGQVVAHFDPTSMVWLNALATNLDHCFNMEAKPVPYMDIYIESDMAKAVVESVDDQLQTRPEGPCLKVQTSRVVISNVRDSDPTVPGSTSSLFNCLEDAQKSDLFFLTNFPSLEEDLQPIPPKFLKHATGDDSLMTPSELNLKFENLQNLDSETLWTEARDVFFINMASVWVEYCQHPKQRGFRCVESFPMNVWVYPKPPVGSQEERLVEFGKKTLEGRREASGSNEADLYVIAHSNSLVNIQISRPEFLFMTRFLDTMTEIGSFLTFDSSRIKGGLQSTIVASVILPQVDVSFVLPIEASHPDGDVTPSDSHVLSSKGTYTYNSNESINVASPVHTKEPPILKSQSEGCITPVPPLDSLSVSPLVKNSAKSGEHVVPKQLDSIHEDQKRAIPILQAPESTGVSDDIDAMSLASNESDNFEHLQWIGSQVGPNNDVMFAGTKFDQDIESALEATEMVTESNHSALDAQLSKKVSTVTVTLSKFRMIVESVGFDSIIKLDSNSIACEEILQYPFQEFLVKIEERTRKWTPQSNLAKPCTFKIRMETEGKLRPNFPISKELESPTGESLFPKCSFKMEDFPCDRYSTLLPVDRGTFLQGEVEDLSFSIHNSTSIALTDLLEDDLVPLPLPMKLNLANVTIQMLEEKTSRNGPKSFSYNINIPRLEVLRNGNNDVTLNNTLPGPIDHSKKSQEMETEIRRLRQENASLQEALRKTT